MTHHLTARLSAGAAAIVLTAIMLVSAASEGRAGLCKKWGEGEKAGALDYLQIDEASGIAVSGKFPGRLYHVNDSGSGPYFYISEMSGGNAKAVRIEGFNALGSDFEDASLGPCFSGKTCFFIADIGDNNERRKFVRIIIIEELQDYGRSYAPLKILKLEYPDRPHNAEGMAVHPNGDIYIFTKEEDLDKMESYPAKLFKIEKESWENAGDGVLKLEYAGELDLPRLNGSGSPFGGVVTSFDIAPSGKTFLVLTYEDAYEFDTDLSASGLKPADRLVRDKDYSVIKLMSLPQQESVSYVEDGRGFIYDSEYHVFDVPIIKVECLGGR
ncbi:MAG: hypothetical protein AB1598_11680 [Thermodesulfobacteriota bacterium]